MFATSTRKRQERSRAGVQHESPPLPGMDSTYGVKSLSDWGGDSVRSELAQPGGDEEVPHDGEDESPSGETALEADLRSALDDRVTADDVGASASGQLQPPLSGSEAKSDQSPQSPGQSSHAGIPPVAEIEAVVHDTPMPLQPSLTDGPEILAPTPASPRHAHGDRGLRLTLRAIDQLASAAGAYNGGRADDMDDDPSEPSSPASFASLPSFIASASSMSRTSSPASGSGIPGFSGYAHGYGGFHGHERPSGIHTYSHTTAREIVYGEPGSAAWTAGSGTAGAGSAMSSGRGDLYGSSELVLPVLALDEGSLHSSTRLRAAGQAGAASGTTKVVVLVGYQEQPDLEAELSRRDEVIAVTEGAWLIKAEDGLGSITIRFGDDHARVVDTVLANYSGLNNLLHPSAARGDSRDQVLAIVDNYALRFPEWVHAVWVQDPAFGIDSLVDLVPTIAPAHTGSAPLFRPSALGGRGDETRSPTPSPTDRIDEPTPMAQGDSSSYFARGTSSPTKHRSPAAVLADQLIALAIDAPALSAASSASFLEWRPAPWDASASSHSSSATPVSSAFDSTGTTDPVPTVTSAHAHGLTEWEANLSRRLAKRKDLAAGEAAAASSSLSGRSARDRGQRGNRPRRRGSREGPSAAADSNRSSHSAPLFPPSSNAAGGNKRPVAKQPAGPRSTRKVVGLAELVNKTFEPFRWIVRSKWTWGAAAAVAFAVAVGWGYWGLQTRA